MAVSPQPVRPRTRSWRLPALLVLLILAAVVALGVAPRLLAPPPPAVSLATPAPSATPILVAAASAGDLPGGGLHGVPHPVVASVSPTATPDLVAESSFWVHLVLAGGATQDLQMVPNATQRGWTVTFSLPALWPKLPLHVELFGQAPGQDPTLMLPLVPRPPGIETQDLVTLANGTAQLVTATAYLPNSLESYILSTSNWTYIARLGQLGPEWELTVAVSYAG